LLDGKQLIESAHVRDGPIGQGHEEAYPDFLRQAARHTFDFNLDRLFRCDHRRNPEHGVGI
jgi:hypothetical protein